MAQFMKVVVHEQKAMNMCSWIIHEQIFMNSSRAFMKNIMNYSWISSWTLNGTVHESSCSWTFHELLIHNMLMKLFMNIEEYLMTIFTTFSWNCSWVFEELLRNNIHESLMKLFMNIWGIFITWYVTTNYDNFCHLLACIYMIYVKFVLKSHRLFPNNLQFTHAPTRWPSFLCTNKPAGVIFTLEQITRAVTFFLDSNLTRLMSFDDKLMFQS